MRSANPLGGRGRNGAVTVQGMRDAEDEKPCAENHGDDTQDKEAGPALIPSRLAVPAQDEDLTEYPAQEKNCAENEGDPGH